MLTGCTNSMNEMVSINSDLTSILSSIRMSNGRKGESTRVSTNLCLSSIVLSPLVSYGRVDVFNSRHSTCETVLLSCFQSMSTFTDLN